MTEKHTMVSTFRATMVLSGSSLVSMGVSLAASKVLATILGPTGFGFYGLLQSFLAVSGLMAGMGVATGLVRLGSHSASQGEVELTTQLRAGAWLLMAAFGSVALLLIFSFRGMLSRWVLGEAHHENAIVLMGIALLFSLGCNVQNGILNACHRVHALATFGVANSTLNAAASVFCVWMWHGQGIVSAIVSGAALSWGASRWLLLRNVKRTEVRWTLSGAGQGAKRLLAFGVPFTASSVAGMGTQLALPMIVLHLLNTQAVAFYKAATAISIGYLGFLVTAMGQDYYPRLAAVREDKRSMLPLIREEYRLVLLVAGPMVLTTIALVPWLVPLIYSRAFGPTVAILEWQLIGDLFKFTSWTMGFAVLARCRPRVYLLTEVSGGIAILTCTWLGTRLFGMTGLGIGFLAGYVAYYTVVRAVLAYEMQFRESGADVALLLAACGAAGLLHLVPAHSPPHVKAGLSLLLAVGFGAHSLRILWRDYISNRLAGRKRAVAVHAVSSVG